MRRWTAVDDGLGWSVWDENGVPVADVFGDDKIAPLIAAAPEMAHMLLPMYSHISHGGPTREECEALLKKAGVIE